MWEVLGNNMKNNIFTTKNECIDNMSVIIDVWSSRRAWPLDAKVIFLEKGIIPAPIQRYTAKSCWHAWLPSYGIFIFFPQEWHTAQLVASYIWLSSFHSILCITCLDHKFKQGINHSSPNCIGLAQFMV